MKQPRGFTLVELMIVVAVIAILAAIVIPTWTKEAQSSRADSEVNAMMTEIVTKEEQYKSEQGNGAYLNIAATCPSAEAPSGSGADWFANCYGVLGWGSGSGNLGLMPPEQYLHCAYQVKTNTAAPAGFAYPMTTPIAPYYYILATCDMDNNSGTTSAQFFRSSFDSKMQKLNYGQ